MNNNNKITLHPTQGYYKAKRNKEESNISTENEREPESRLKRTY